MTLDGQVCLSYLQLRITYVIFSTLGLHENFTIPKVLSPKSSKRMSQDLLCVNDEENGSVDTIREQQSSAEQVDSSKRKRFTQKKYRYL